MARRPKPMPDTAPAAEALSPLPDAAPSGDNPVTPSIITDEGAISSSSVSDTAMAAPHDKTDGREQPGGDSPSVQDSTPVNAPQVAGEGDDTQARGTPVATRPSYLTICLMALVTGGVGGGGAAILVPRYMPQFIAPMGGSASVSSSPATPSGAAPLPAAALDRLTALETAIEAQVARDSSLRAEISALGTRMADSKQANAGLDDPARLARVETQLAALAENHAALATLSLCAARLAASERLVHMLHQGMPLSGALDHLKTLGVAAEKLAALGSFAVTGAPGLAALRTEFTTTRASIIAAKAAEEKARTHLRAEAEAEEARNAPPAGWWDGLLAKAGAIYQHAKQKTASLIEIRGKGEKPVPLTPSDRAVEEAITKGDMAAAIAALDGASEVDLAAYAALRSRLDARLKAFAAAQALVVEGEAALHAAARAAPQ